MIYILATGHGHLATISRNVLSTGNVRGVFLRIDGSEATFQIGDEVVDVFDAHGNPD